MRICLCTPYYPTVGGVTMFSDAIARAMCDDGHEISLVTDILCEPALCKDYPFAVVHRARRSEFYRAAMRCDVFVHNNVCLRALWPVPIIRGKYVVIHHGYYHAFDTTPDWRARLKLRIARRWAANVFVSSAVRDHVAASGPVIANPYNDVSFRPLGLSRDTDLVFAGRLVSDKGAQILLDALVHLRDRHLQPSVIIAGDGPERRILEGFVARERLQNQVTFVGHQTHDLLPQVLNRCRIMVVPSTVNEGLPIAVLEGIACGCVVVGTDAGGLAEAVGPCGVTFPRGDHRALAAVLAELLGDATKLEPYRQAAPAHLAEHRAKVAAQKYIDFFHEVMNTSPI